MQQPGWYDDPSGQPNRFRFWDGQAWTTATTDNPHTPWPRPAGGAPGRGAPNGLQGPARTASERGRSKSPVIIAIAAALVLAVLGVGGFWLTTRGGTPAVTPSPAPPPGVPAPPPTTAPTMPTGEPAPGTDAALNCSGGNNLYSRRTQPSYHSTGITYQAVPDWKFSFAPQYWSWLDDHSSMGAIRLDGGQNEAGITLGGVRFENGFADQSTAGERSLECLEGTLSVEEPTRAGPATTEETTLGGMRTFHTRSEFTSASTSTPLVVNVYVVDSGQGNKWAQLITFHRAGSSAERPIQTAVDSVRHI